MSSLSECLEEFSSELLKRAQKVSKRSTGEVQVIAAEIAQLGRIMDRITRKPQWGRLKPWDQAHDNIERAGKLLASRMSKPRRRAG